MSCVIAARKMSDDGRTRGTNLGAKEVGSERKSEKDKVQSEILTHQEKRGLPKKTHEGGRQEVATCGHGASENVGAHAVEMARTERDKLRRQMAAAAAGKKSATSLSLFMEVCGLEEEEELSNLATQFWAEGVWTVKWYREQREAWMKQIQEVQLWRKERGPAGAVMCETRDLGFKWPQWHTLTFEGEIRVDMRYACPKDVTKMLLQRARTVCWKKWAAKHEIEELKEGVWLELALALLQKKTKGRLD